MPATSDLTSVIDQQLLMQLGARLKFSRKKQGLTTAQLAERAGISRMTLSAIEAGEPTPTMGSYLRVMSVLQVSKDLALLASETLESSAEGLPKKLLAPGRLVVSASQAKHELQDLQSLVLHQEAVRLMQKQPELVQQALDTLDRWRQSGDSHSRFLWDEWSVILHRRAWRRALSHTKRSKELRQASPLPTILPTATRQQILAEVRRLKNGVPIALLTSPKQGSSAEGVSSGT
jgi:transcriptional regulator with XRE-family HTH domain